MPSTTPTLGNLFSDQLSGLVLPAFHSASPLAQVFAKKAHMREHFLPDLLACPVADSYLVSKTNRSLVSFRPVLGQPPPVMIGSSKDETASVGVRSPAIFPSAAALMSS